MAVARGSQNEQDLEVKNAEVQVFDEFEERIENDASNPHDHQRHQENMNNAQEQGGDNIDRSTNVPVDPGADNYVANQNDQGGNARYNGRDDAGRGRGARGSRGGVRGGVSHGREGVRGGVNFGRGRGGQHNN